MLQATCELAKPLACAFGVWGSMYEGKWHGFWAVKCVQFDRSTLGLTFSEHIGESAGPQRRSLPEM